MKKIVGILSLILCFMTFFISPSAWADEQPAIVEEGEIWKQSSPTFTVQGGEVYHGSFAEPDIWTLLNGTGKRTFTTHIYFEEPSQKPPTVIVSLTGMDVDKTANNRITVKPINITETGFDLEYATWGDSHIYSVWSTWTALANNG